MGRPNKKTEKPTAPRKSRTMIVRTDSLRKNPWNPNQQDPETFERVKASILEHGNFQPTVVRETPTGLEILDGEHKWRAETELGHEEMEVVNMGPISDQQAQKITIIANELRGQADPTKLAHLIDQLAKNEDLEALSQTLPLSEQEMTSMINSIKPFDFGDIETPAEPENGTPTPSLSDFGKDVQVKIGNVKGAIPSSVMDTFMEEYVLSAKAVGTRNMEAVFRDLTARLRSARPAPVDGAVTAVGPEPQAKAERPA